MVITMTTITITVMTTAISKVKAHHAQIENSLRQSDAGEVQNWVGGGTVQTGNHAASNALDAHVN